jgi:hypothetical protein
MNGNPSKFTTIHWLYSCPFVGYIAQKRNIAYDLKVQDSPNSPKVLKYGVQSSLYKCYASEVNIF